MLKKIGINFYTFQLTSPYWMLERFFKNKHRTYKHWIKIYLWFLSFSLWYAFQISFSHKTTVQYWYESNVCIYHGTLLTQKPSSLWGRWFSVNEHKAPCLNPDIQPETHNKPYSIFKSFSRHQIKWKTRLYTYQQDQPLTVNSSNQAH